MKDPEQQIKDVVEQLRKILPLKTGLVKMVVTVPSSAWAKARSLLLGQGNIISEKWSDDGEKVTLVAEVPVGSQMLLFERIGEMGGQAKVE
jgi:ribosome maturation protein SDO1